MSSHLFVIILGLCFCPEESSQLSLEHPVFSGPSEALAKQAVDFQCEIPNPKNQSILLQIFKRGEHNNLLGEYTLLKGEEVAVIPKVIKPNHEGYLECVARVQNNSEIIPTVSNTYFLKVIEPVKGAAIVVSGQTELYEEHKLELQCKLQKGSHVTYKWLLNNQPIFPSPYHVFAENRLVISRVTSMDNGSYVCNATNIFNNTEVFISESPEVVIKIKDLVSTPDISFTVLKDHNQNYFATVTCQSTRGTLPISFSLYNNTELVSNLTTEEKQASFKVPVVMNHLVQLQCQANNGDKTAYSHWLPLEVVPVAAPVLITYKYDMAENYAVIGLRLYCKAAKGSHPQFQWYHNNMPLNDRGSYYYVYNQLPKESILLLSVGRSSAGKYHCEVSDSFDNTTSINSTRRYFDEEVLNRLPDIVVAVVFGCFAVLNLLVFFCCLMGVMFRQRKYKEKSLLNLEMEMVAAENELDLSGYSEDPDVVETAKEDEFDQTSEVSVDEWSQIKQKTLMDEPVSATF
ncbi:platelet endothelial cell adhesion molecule isoform X2 [Melanotaenia boesemani]|uniref:platelet endothelial cell adhesion molecule isoform X2 n=1 Tax=Melanotaenia boesemani TaxID=1250792 RepID=UPI001C04DF34|nr:platelet endothelial cell adhesion molecule isoform X2 [Melanotaenia boesemani]